MSKKLRFYIRGLGIGIVVTALLLSIAGKKDAPEMTDAQIRSRATQLGMVDAGSLTVTEAANNNTETAESTEVPEEPAADQEAASQSGGVSVMVPDGEEAESTESGQTEEPAEEPAQTEEPAEEPARTEEPAEETAQTEEPAETEAPAEEPAQTETPAEEPSEGNDGSLGGVKTGETVTITVKSGYGSEKIAGLVRDAGLISSASDFDDYLVKNGYSTILRTGTFSIPVGAGYEEIAKILTGRS